MPAPHTFPTWPFFRPMLTQRASWKLRRGQQFSNQSKSFRSSVRNKKQTRHAKRANFRHVYQLCVMLGEISDVLLLFFFLGYTWNSSRWSNRFWVVLKAEFGGCYGLLWGNFFCGKWRHGNYFSRCSWCNRILALFFFLFFFCRIIVITVCV